MAASDINIESPAECNVKLVKWKVKKGSMISKGAVLALYIENDAEEKAPIKKLKASRSGIVTQIIVEQDMIAKPGDVVMKMQDQADTSCKHPTIMKDMCADCGADLRVETGVSGDRKKSVSASVAMVHCIPELIISQEHALELGRKDEERLLEQKKLVLLVDLDQTLIHTTNDNIPHNLKGVKHFKLWHGRNCMWYHTRFRPFTMEFIEAVSKMYELHICTFGVRMYAHTIARLLDPKEQYFSHRILSRDECFDALSKTANLKALFPCGDKMVGIIDDREDVWNYAPNLIHVKPYRFFQGTADINAPPGLTKSEHDNEPIDHKVVNPSTKDKKQDTEKGEKDNSKDNEGSGESLGDKESELEKNNLVDNVKSDSAEGLEIGEKTHVSKVNDIVDESGKDTSKKTDNVDILDKKQLESNNEDNESKDVKDKYEVENENSGTEKSVNGSGKLDCAKADAETIEWEDDDDYLLHLQEILTRVHKAFYEMYDQSQKSSSNEMPDLKNIMPYVRKKVLKGANIVFSGMFPLNMVPEKSKAYTIAKALGANVQSDIVVRKGHADSDQEATTHLVAAKAGTGKHKSALRVKGIRIVHGDWLWACSERWEWGSEALYPLASESPETVTPTPSKGKNKKRKAERDSGDGKQINADELEECGGPSMSKNLKLGIEGEQLPSTSKTDKEPERFANSINPLYSFSDEDIEFMDKEVDEMLDEDGGSSDESDAEREKRVRKNVLSKARESDSDSDSLSGDFPRGWKMRRKSFSPQHKEEIEEAENKTESQEDEETENELERYEKNIAAFGPRDSGSESNDDSIGSVDDEIADAVEKEFLNSL